MVVVNNGDFLFRIGFALQYGPLFEAGNQKIDGFRHGFVDIQMPAACRIDDLLLARQHRGFDGAGKLRGGHRPDRFHGSEPHRALAPLVDGIAVRPDHIEDRDIQHLERLPDLIIDTG